MWKDGNGGEGGGMGDGYSSDSGGISTVAAGRGRGIWIRRRFSMIWEFASVTLRVNGSSVTPTLALPHQAEGVLVRCGGGTVGRAEHSREESNLYGY